MLLFGHIGITLGIFFVFSYIAPRLKTIIDRRYLVIGALLPDLIDKPLGMIVFASIISNGRMISHTLLFSITLCLIGLYFYDKRSDIVIITLASGSFFHLMEDQMWNTPKTLFWPLLGWSFPKDNIADGIAFLLMLLKESFMINFPKDFIPEIIGMMVIVIFTLNWLKNKLSKTNSKDEGIKKEITKKPPIETTVFYIIGFLVFGLLSVRAIIAL
ncbi:metal-dependent hydrolase [Methanosarcina sp. UBA5]|uniref:metal-dependent hydrolase n=1 Tax=Methanosarcina sp. UBA5 TaxID=1915593 RepID=UPI0025DF38BC|nr:metal-dependent hydrolase [Methanosarcina sp. UBA5]